MKIKKLEKKLSFNKQTVSNLNEVKGGETGVLTCWGETCVIAGCSGIGATCPCTTDCTGQETCAESCYVC